MGGMGIQPMNHGLEAHATLAIIHSYGNGALRDYERFPETVAGLHYVAFAILMLTRLTA